jgi:hypothetical protein
VTFDSSESGSSGVVRSKWLLGCAGLSCDGGNAEDCGGGGVELDVAVEGIVW